MKRKIGLQLFSLYEYTQTTENLAKTLAKVSQIGYTAIQASGIGASITSADVLKICEDNGLQIAATHTGLADLIGKTEDVIAKHKLWGCKHTAVGSLSWDYYAAGIDGIKKFVDEVSVFAPKLLAEGIDFSYHNHDVEMMPLANGRSFLETLYEMAPAELLKAEIDTFWIQAGGGSPETWIRRYPGRQPLLHLKDMTVHPTGGDWKREARYAPVGEGNLDWKNILTAAKQSECEWYLVEQDGSYERDPFECIASSLKFLTEYDEQ